MRNHSKPQRRLPRPADAVDAWFAAMCTAWAVLMVVCIVATATGWSGYGPYCIALIAGEAIAGVGMLVAVIREK